MVKKVFRHSEENGLSIVEFGNKQFGLFPIKKKLLRPHFTHVSNAGFQTTGGGNSGDDDDDSGSGSSGSGSSSSGSGSGSSSNSGKN